jgi:SSS family solute:Na+ symporter
MIHFSLIDLLLILGYFCAIVFVGFRAARKEKTNTDEFLLAGRTLTLPVFVATLVSTWYGGILGVGEFSYRYGISNWFILGVPYYVFAFIFAFLLAKRVRASRLYTIPDKLELAYDKPTAILGGILTFILATPAAYVLMLGVLVQVIFGLSLEISIIITTVVTVCYLLAGGFRSDVHVNVVEFILMFLGFIVMLVFAVSKYGGSEFIHHNVPPLHLTIHGGNSTQYIVVWFFIALWTLVDPAFHQRCYAARDGKTAQRGIFVSILFWFIFDFLTSVAGLYARAVIPDLEKPTLSYPCLAEAVLPPVAKGLFYIGMLATIMSTLSSLMLISGITLGKDIVFRIWPGISEEKINRMTRYGIIIASIIAIAIALGIPSVVEIWYTIGTVIVPGLLIPVVASYYEKLKPSPRWAYAIMAGGFTASLCSLVYGYICAVEGKPHYFFGIEPMYPGLILSAVLWISERVIRKQG